MEEKERYVIRYDLEYNQCVIDTEENQGVGDCIRIVKLLNQQDKRIKELENKNARLSQGIYWGNGEQFCDVVKKIKEEKQQLNKRIKELEEEKKVGEFWHSAYQGKQLEYDMVYAELRKSMDESQQLKQQLHDLPKNIVGEIENELLPEFSGGKDYEHKYYIITKRILDTILKKYELLKNKN